MLETICASALGRVASKGLRCLAGPERRKFDRRMQRCQRNEQMMSVEIASSGTAHPGLPDSGV